MSTTRRRLDAEMVRRGIVDSRTRAATLIEAGDVLVGGAPAPKASRLVAPGEAIEVLGPGPRFVSRGGDKLDAALIRFGIDVEGCRSVDAGASTGGFTDCLLHHGARSVVAIDVGHGQLDARLRDDPRVEVLERTNIRSISPSTIGGPADLLVADLSFISLRTVAASLVGLCRPGAPMVVLVKPQFEAGRAEVSRGRGVIRDPGVRRAAVGSALDSFTSIGADMMGFMASPLRGADGNAEFLAWLRTPVATGGATTGRLLPAAQLDEAFAAAEEGD